MPGRAAGVTEAVRHLIAHGHRKIAFAGFRVSRDIIERYEAYRDCLLEHGITPDPALVYDTGNNQISGGEAAARAMIAAGLPSTAVITGNDHNAMGLLRTLTAAGYDLPSDQAVVGFDDIEAAVYLTPNLSTVRQDFVKLGTFAADLLLAQIRGEEVAHGAHYVPTEFVTRESCGCPSTLSLRADTLTPGNDVRSREQLNERLGAMLAVRTCRRGVDQFDLPRATEMICRVLRAAIDGTPAPPLAEVWQSLAGLYALCPDMEDLIAIMRMVRRLGRHLATEHLPAGDTTGRERVEDALQELNLALSLAQARSNFADVANYEQNFIVQHDVSMRLLRSADEEDPRSLGWLHHTSAQAAVLALWRPEPEDPGGWPVLRVEGVFHATDPGWTLDAHPLTVESFPPAEVVELGDPAVDHMVFVAPMITAAGENGLLAVVGPIEARLYYGREIVNQWAALLTSALDHRTVLESLRTQEELLRHAALYDELTGLPNRALLFERLNHAIEQGKRHEGFEFGLCLLDLDGFKLVNDSLGHLAGDQLLVEVAQRIQSCLRGTDFAARLGGDEFAVLLDGLGDEEGAAVVVGRLREALAQPCLVAGQEIVVTASVGVALSAKGYDRPEDLIRDSDIAMYSAKTREKGTHAVFDVTMLARTVERLNLERELRRAVDQAEFDLYYQPIVDLATGRTLAFEALIRWRHPERGMLSPAEFLPVAEESGLMLPIGQWVLAEACRQLGAWRRELGEVCDVHLNVNIDNHQFWHGRLLADLETSLRAADLEPYRIRAEITEGVIMHDVRQARRLLDGLHDFGVDVHIDDFGTGYSSLEALNHLPIDALKIDRSFITPLPDDRRSEELVRAIIAMSKNLGLKLVAEGIETEDQRNLLQRLGCNFGQGYWFARPLPAEAARRHIIANARTAASRTLVGTCGEAP